MQRYTKGLKMHSRVTISLPPELAKEWTKQAKKHSLVKSVMVQNYLKKVLPILEQKEPYDVINFRIEDNSGSLFT
jgi:Holliday junction resolvase RusA-like endonuclease